MPTLPTPEEGAYMAAHADDNLVPDIIVCCSVCGVASVLWIVLRLVARRLTSGHFRVELSDWLLMIAWVFFAVFDICFAMTTMYGGGRHVIQVTDGRMLQILNIVDENLYCYAMAFIKFSLLSLYGRIFPSRRFRYLLWAVAAFMAAWAVSIAIVAIFQCTPIAYGWDPTIAGGYCLNYGLVVLVAGVANIATDFLILTMPIPLVWQLHTSAQKRWLLIFTFAMGGSACIISIVRLAFALKVGTTADGSWDNIPAGLLSVVELMVGILAASIPTYRPLYRWLARSAGIGGSAGRSTTTTAARYGRPGYGSHGSGQQHGYAKETTTPHSVRVSAGRRSGRASAGAGSGSTGSTGAADHGHGHGHGLGFGHSRPGIYVTDHVELVMHTNKSGAWVRVQDEDEDEAPLYEPGGAEGSRSSAPGSSAS